MNLLLREELESIYALIPSFTCQHCHECCGPIVWFKPEEENIRDHLRSHNLPYITWTAEEFISHNNRCPYLLDERCSIYPVRPLVCRLQGFHPDLPCKKNSASLNFFPLWIQIKEQFESLLEKHGWKKMFFSTRKEYATYSYSID